MAHLYYAEDLPLERFTPGDSLAVTGDEARHAVRVSRLRVGESISVGDGRGTVAHGEVTHASALEFTVKINEVESASARTPRICLVQALAKGDRSERSVEMATEFGVDGFIPWQADRSISRWDAAKAVKGQAKWAKIAREAAKQSLRPWVPEVQPLETTDDIASRLANENAQQVIVLDPAAPQRLTNWLMTVDREKDILMCVGPEGGVSPRELNLLRDAGAIPLSLGPETLRASSAGSAALAVCNVALGRW